VDVDENGTGKEGLQSRISAVVDQPETTDAVRSGRIIEIHLLINGPKLRHFEILRFLQSRGWNNETVGARTGRAGVAGIALQAEGACVDVVGEEEGVFACDSVATGEIGRIGAIEILIRVWLESDRVDEVAIGVHVRSRNR